jgi:beta-mannosidase
VKQTFDLTRGQWTLRGWHAWNWKLALARETGVKLLPVAGPISVRVPGSVQRALRDAGVIPDWNVATNSLAAEWVENRHWTFETKLPLKLCRQPGRKLLACDGLDGAGVIRCGDAEIGQFASAFVPHRFELADAIADYLAQNPRAKFVPLVIAFTDIPRNLGQVNFTSRIRDEKPRFNYVWDWMPRLVQIGIWDGVRLEISDGPEIAALRMFTEFDPKTESGAVRIFAKARKAVGVRWRVSLWDKGRKLTTIENPASRDKFKLSTRGIEKWWPAHVGQQPLYDVRVELLDPSGSVLDIQTRRVGFREVRWTACAGAPPNAEPWILNVNRQPVFVAGVNWTPIRPNFADVTDTEIRARLATYRDLGFNLIRVWGGAVLERESFYQACDELGLLVWQEFPFSSSGIDNWPPDDQAAVKRAGEIAESYIARRQHHTSLIVWCGGNELQFGSDGKSTGGGVPVGYAHPPIAAMQRVVRRLDPTRRFLPTSPFGPRFSIEAKAIGKGEHHCVHGPWKIPGSMREWKKYWEQSDALFHSEAGVPGAAAAKLIRKFCGDSGLPADETHPAWRHAAAWWIQWRDYLKSGGNPNSLAAFVRWSQQCQAEGLAIVFRACLGKFPRCGGFIVWMGHDAFPCPCNTSILDFNGQPKHAALALRDILRPNIPRKNNKYETTFVALPFPAGGERTRLFVRFAPF